MPVQKKKKKLAVHAFHCVATATDDPDDGGGGGALLFYCSALESLARSLPLLRSEMTVNSGWMKAADTPAPLGDRNGPESRVSPNLLSPFRGSMYSDARL